MTLVLANAVMLALVLVLGMSAFQVLVLYWVECVVIGFFNVLRMIDPKAPGPTSSKMGGLIIFGMFYSWFLAGTLMGIFLSIGHVQIHDENNVVRDVVAALLAQPGLGQATTSFFLSHGISFTLNYVVGDEDLRADTTKLMLQPLRRVGALLLALIVTVAFVQWLGSPLPALVGLVVIKTALDLHAHLAERRKFAGGEPAARLTAR